MKGFTGFWKNTVALLGLFVGMLAVGASVAAHAAPQESQVTEAGKVYISDKIFCFIRSGAAGMSVKERADAIRERLRDILSLQDLKGSDVAVSGNKKAATVKVRGKLLITVDDKDAKTEKLPGALAYGQKLAKNLRQSFKFLPKVGEEPASKQEKDKKGE